MVGRNTLSDNSFAFTTRHRHTSITTYNNNNNNENSFSLRQNITTLNGSRKHIINKKKLSYFYFRDIFIILNFLCGDIIIVGFETFQFSPRRVEWNIWCINNISLLYSFTTYFKVLLLDTEMSAFKWIIRELYT